MILRSLQLLIDPRQLAGRWLPDRRQVRSAAYLAAGNVLKLGLGLISSAVIFRWLGPDLAGKLALVFSLVGLLSIMGEFGLRDGAVNYIARFATGAPQQAFAVGRTFLLSRMILAALASLIGWAGAGWVAIHFYPTLQVAGLIRLGALSLLADGLLGFVMVILEARQQFGMIAALGIVQAVLRAGCVVALALAHTLTLGALLILESAIPLAAVLYSLRWIPRDFIAPRRPLFQSFPLLFHFAKWIAVAALSSAIFLKLDVLLLGRYRTPAEVGMYAVALALVAKLDVLKNAVLTTAFPEACRRTDRASLRGYIRQVTRLTSLATVLCLPLFVIGGAVIGWLYGPQYQAAVPALYPLLGAFLIGLNAEPAAYVLYPLNRPRWIAASDVLQLVFCALASVVLIPRGGILGAAWSVLLTRLLAALITSGLVWRFVWKAEQA